VYKHLEQFMNATVKNHSLSSFSEDRLWFFVLENIASAVDILAPISIAAQ